MVRVAVAVRSLFGALNAAYLQIATAVAIVIVFSAIASYWSVRRILPPPGADPRRGGTAGRRRAAASFARVGRRGDQHLGGLAQPHGPTARPALRTVLRQQHEHEVVLSSMEEGVLAVDNRAVVLNVNEAFCRLLGVKAVHVRGRLLHEVVRKPDLLRFIESALGSDTPVHDDLHFLGLEDRCFNAHGTVLHDSEHLNIGALVVLHDVTELRRLENVRRDFVANVSHELRTPITSIKGFVETLLEDGLADSQNALRFLRIIHRQVNRLDSLIEDLLSLSRIERGAEEQPITLEPKPLIDVLRAAIELCEPKAGEKEVRVEMECPADLRAAMNATLLEQAVSNLIDNAIKHSEAGSVVRVTARARGRGLADRGRGPRLRHRRHTLAASVRAFLSRR